MSNDFIITARPDERQHPVYRAIEEVVNLAASDVAIVPTRPLYEGDKRWILFIEDWVTLYNPEIVNGKTAGIDVLNHPRTAALRKKFADPRFIGIACHHPGTFQDLHYLNLTDKLFYFPYGIKYRAANNLGASEKIAFTFINSWMAGNGNFYPRGGELVCRAFRQLWESGERRATLSIAAEIPSGVESREFMLHCPGVHVSGRHISDSEFDDLMIRTDCVLLPSHRVHVNSLLRPMSHGIPVISSDGWGNDEYVIDGINGYRVRGIFGRTTWHQHVMREDYSRWPETLDAVGSIVALMRRMIEDRAHLKRLGRNAHDYVREFHPPERMRSALGCVFAN